MNPKPETRNSKLKVLLIEDNPEDALLLRRTLAKVTSAQFELTHVERLGEALQRLGEESFEVVLLDLALPDSQGLEAFVKLHAQAPEAPIVVLTGLDDEALAVKAVQEGAQDYLVKGHVDSSLLVRSVRYAIERQRMLAELAKYTHELQTSEARLRNIIEKNIDGIVIVDGNGIVRFVNPAAEALFGRKAGELLGELFGFPVVAGETMEVDIIRRGGETVAAEMRVVETVWEGEHVYLASLRDITAKKELERQRADFLAMLTHDIKNPLGVILGHAGALRQMGGGLSPEQEAMVRRLEMNTQAALSLVNNYLDLSKIEAGRLTLVKKPLGLNDLLSRVGRQYEAEAQRQRITLEFHLQEELPAVEGDALALERVFANLVHNALKFTPKLGRVTISTGQQDNEVVTAVIDTGSGIAAEEVPIIFEKYRRAGVTRQREGTGLGLFIVKVLVEAHGGSIKVESTVGSGSCFSVYLPMASAAQVEV